MEFETPDAMLRRLKLGREEYCQRLLTSLILHGPYPRWNSRNRPAATGLAFLAALYQRSYGEPWPGDDVWFVDELELAPRHDAEKGGAPDYAVLWDDRIWIIELKTEKASHRHDQIPLYFELGHHHFPKATVDLLYLTPPMDAPFDPGASWARYAHTTWADLTDLIQEVWPSGVDLGQQAVIDGLLDAIGSLTTTPREWRARLAESTTETSSEAPRSPVGTGDALELALEAAALTAADGQQRGIEWTPADLENLLALRLEVRDALAATPASSPLRHIVPWTWRPESEGQALTDSGREHGFELRVSRYANPRY